MTLRYKFALPINLILLLALLASLAWQWRRLEESGRAVLRARLGEEARFVHAAYRQFGPSARFDGFLAEFCHATDALASPEHQVALLDASGRVIASAAEHARSPMDPVRLAALGEGAWRRDVAGEPFLIHIAPDGPSTVVVAESLRAVRARVVDTIRDQAAWFLLSGLLLIGAVNLIMNRAVLRPVRHLYRAARRMEKGQLGVQVEAQGGDELATLGRQFNAMSRAIAAQVEADRRELEAARQVQQHLLPPPVARIGCLEVAGRCVQAHPVGGDLYDIQALPDGRVGLVVADLSGHNVAAALHTAMVRAMLWREAERSATPGEALARLSERLCRQLPEGHFATLFFGWFEPRHGRLVYSNAGHPAGLIRLPGAPVRVLEATGVPLGILPGAAYESVSLAIEPGSLLLAYTDGLSEARNPQGELLGNDEAISALASWEDGAILGLVDRLMDRAVQFRGDQSPQDDVTVVLVRYTTETGPLGRPLDG